MCAYGSHYAGGRNRKFVNSKQGKKKFCPSRTNQLSQRPREGTELVTDPRSVICLALFSKSSACTNFKELVQHLIGIMRNLRSIRHRVSRTDADVTALCWDAGRDEVLLTHGPTEDKPRIELFRIVEDAIAKTW